MFVEPLKNLQKLANLHAEENSLKNFKCLKGLDICKGLVTIIFDN